LYRANPNYKSGIWQDWAYCDWGENYGVCPIHLLCFLDLTSLKTDLTVNDIFVEKGCIAAVVHMIENPIDKKSDMTNDQCSDYSANNNSWLFFKAKKWCTNNTNDPKLAIVNVLSIHGPCNAVPVSLNNTDNHESNLWYLFLKSRNEWSEVLVELMKKSNKISSLI